MHPDTSCTTLARAAMFASAGWHGSMCIHMPVPCAAATSQTYRKHLPRTRNGYEAWARVHMHIHMHRQTCAGRSYTKSPVCEAVHVASCTSANENVHVRYVCVGSRARVRAIRSWACNPMQVNPDMRGPLCPSTIGHALDEKQCHAKQHRQHT